MKFTDDYKAKYEIWARNPRVVRMPRIANLPKFPPQKFNNYEELHAFKKWLLDELARKGGARWTWDP
ncbi:MAG TPA: hypothetical protein VIH35_00515 [Kiritimatiellia bacterium]|jgi:hypothetical protein